jgi:hypothetical protein
MKIFYGVRNDIQVVLNGRSDQPSLGEPKIFNFKQVCADIVHTGDTDYTDCKTVRLIEIETGET